MGYNASGSGSVVLKKEVPEEILELLNSSDVGFETEDSPDGGLWLTFYYDRYHEDDVIHALNKLAPYTKSGDIEFTGDDDMHWQFHFYNGKMEERNGEVIYRSKNAMRTVNVGFQYEDPQEGLVDDETQFDLVDADFGTMFAELHHLFRNFAEENGWNDSNCWISYVEEVPYDGEGAE